MNESGEGTVRVLKFVNHFHVGGTECQFVAVANGLNRARFKVDVACFRRVGPLVDILKSDVVVHTYPVHGGSYTIGSIRSQLRLLKDVRRRHFDIVHTYGWYPNVFAIPASRLAFRPAIIASIRDAGAYMTPAKIKALKFVCRLSNRVLANSNAGRTWLVEQGVDDQKIEVIRNGIVVPESAEHINAGPVRLQFGIPAGAPVCACIGRVVSGKGIDDYLKAAQILKERGRDVRFLMIGGQQAEKNYPREMEQLASRLNVADRVIFTGHLQDIPSILREVDVVVHPSLSEGLSNVILEAMASAVPVVATRTGGNPELVEDGRTGFLISTQNALEMADAVCRLLDEPAMMRAFGERARRRVIDEFNVTGMLARVEELYLRVREKPATLH